MNPEQQQPVVPDQASAPQQPMPPAQQAQPSAQMPPQSAPQPVQQIQPPAAPTQPAIQQVVPPQVEPQAPLSSQPTQTQEQDVAAVNSDDQDVYDDAPHVAPVQWQAPEYIEHEKTPLWFAGFWGVVVVLMIAAAFIVKSWSFTILVPVMAAALMFYSHRPPRLISYLVDNRGLYINEQLHPMEEFRAFGVLQEEAIPALMLIPRKRFRPSLTIHFPEEVGESLVDMIGTRIPMQDLQPDAFDKIVRKLRI